MQKVEDLVFGGWYYRISRDIRRTIEDQRNLGNLQSIEEINEKGTHGKARYIATKQELVELAEFLPGKSKRKEFLCSVEKYFDTASQPAEAAPVAATDLESKPTVEVDEATQGTVVICGSQIETFVTDGRPWVSLPSICRPFNKRPEDQLERIRDEGWAGTRLIRVPAPANRGGVQETWCLHADDVPLVVAGFSPKGMSPEIKASWIRFKVECAGALASYFGRGVASNPRFSEEQRRVSFDEDVRRIAEVAAKAAGDALKNALPDINGAITEMATKLSDRMDKIEKRPSGPTFVTSDGAPVRGAATLTPFAPLQDGEMYPGHYAEENEVPVELVREVCVRLGVIGDPAWGRAVALTTETRGPARKKSWVLNRAVQAQLELHNAFFKREYEKQTSFNARNPQMKAIAATTSRISSQIGIGTETKFTFTDKKNQRVLGGTK